MDIPPEQSLIEYPCAFPIKVMGLNTDEFVPQMTAVARRFDENFGNDQIEVRASSGGKYLGLTLTVTVVDRPQLDNLYRALTGHPLVKYVI